MSVDQTSFRGSMYSARTLDILGGQQAVERTPV
jgi:hypothetical protein